MTRDEIKNFGLWLKEQRRARQYTQAILAKELDIAVGTISAIEQGTIASIGRKLYNKICNFFDNSSLNDGVGTNEQKPKVDSISNNNEKKAIQFDVDAITERIASLILEPDFRQRVNGIMTYLRCSEKEALVIILRKELNN